MIFLSVRRLNDLVYLYIENIVYKNKVLILILADESAFSTYFKQASSLTPDGRGKLLENSYVSYMSIEAQFVKTTNY